MISSSHCLLYCKKILFYKKGGSNQSFAGKICLLDIMDKFNRKKNVELLSKLKEKDIIDVKSDSKLVNDDSLSKKGWMKEEKPWIKYPGNSQTKILIAIGIKNISATQLKELTKLGATIENGEKLIFDVDQSEKVQKILGEAFNLEDLSNSIKKKK